MFREEVAQTCKRDKEGGGGGGAGARAGCSGTTDDRALCLTETRYRPPPPLLLLLLPPLLLLQCFSFRFISRCHSATFLIFKIFPEKSRGDEDCEDMKRRTEVGHGHPSCCAAPGNCGTHSSFLPSVPSLLSFFLSLSLLPRLN